jgi:hypothetical protein
VLFAVGSALTLSACPVALYGPPAIFDSAVQVDASVPVDANPSDATPTDAEGDLGDR